MSLMKDYILDNDLPLFRVTDPDTSAQGAKDIKVRQGSQMWLLLEQYAYTRLGLTDEEAGKASGLAAKGAGYWKRCSDLRTRGLIVDTGVRRAGTSGSLMQVCVLTAEGIKLLGDNQ